MLDTPEWLGEEPRTSTAGSKAGQLLYRPPNRMQIPVRATVIRKLVRRRRSDRRPDDGRDPVS